jgi:hypothetical protein
MATSPMPSNFSTNSVHTQPSTTTKTQEEKPTTDDEVKNHPLWIGDFHFTQPYYNPKRHRNLHPFCVVYQIWNEAKPNSKTWHFLKSYASPEKALQAATSLGTRRQAYSIDKGQTWQHHHVVHAAATLLLPKSD